MTTRYYHFYEDTSKTKNRSRRRNIEAVTSAKEARKVRDYYNSMKIPTAIFINQSKTSPEYLPFGERLWL